MFSRVFLRWRALSRLSCVVMLSVLAAPVAPAFAHPHVFVVATATINIKNGSIASITHTWTFDEYYTAMAVEGLPKNGDGGYGRSELAELAKVNIDGLKEFGYFTFATLGKEELKINEPKESEYWLDYTGGLLALHFTVALQKPVPIDVKGFAVVITDPSYFIAFELSDKDPPKLNADAPKSCKLAVGAPKEETAQEKKLSGAFAEQAAPANLGLGSIAQSIMVSCGP